MLENLISPSAYCKLVKEGLPNAIAAANISEKTQLAERTLLSHLELFGLTILDKPWIKGDGLCFYYATTVLDRMTKKEWITCREECTSEFRKNIIAFMISSGRTVVPGTDYTLMETLLGRGCLVDSVWYEAVMKLESDSGDDRWADAHVITATAMYQKRDLYVIYSDGKNISCTHFLSGVKNAPGRYLVNINNKHFALVGAIGNACIDECTLGSLLFNESISTCSENIHFNTDGSNADVDEKIECNSNSQRKSNSMSSGCSRKKSTNNVEQDSIVDVNSNVEKGNDCDSSGSIKKKKMRKNRGRKKKKIVEDELEWQPSAFLSYHEERELLQKNKNCHLECDNEGDNIVDVLNGKDGMNYSV